MPPQWSHLSQDREPIAQLSRIGERRGSNASEKSRANAPQRLWNLLEIRTSRRAAQPVRQLMLRADGRACTLLPPLLANRLHTDSAYEQASLFMGS